MPLPLLIKLLIYKGWVHKFKGFPAGSVSKESACNAGDSGSIPGWGRPLEEDMATHSRRNTTPWQPIPVARNLQNFWNNSNLPIIPYHKLNSEKGNSGKVTPPVFLIIKYLKSLLGILPLLNAFSLDSFLIESFRLLYLCSIIAIFHKNDFLSLIYY